ncbi:hypothetical protein [Acidovorax sp. SUPP3334]|uniref:hypothetical protein n=1 Tax=Acidovorax sp. SUPP3334 TaxID=2920881 RepID=UPI0023DE3171|nr:hypothetical protein [Acidovorax sp. SUPP3334]GKT20971.1 hypothetical protein AVHM3334_03055 [Acidovorax sp. SUPP3334]
MSNRTNGSNGADSKTNDLIDAMNKQQDNSTAITKAQIKNQEKQAENNVRSSMAEMYGKSAKGNADKMASQA